MVVRKDLTRPQQAVQACHAVIEATKAYSEISTLEHPHVIIVSIENEAKLRATVLKLAEAGISCREFIEPDIGNQMTAIASRPVFGDERRHFRRFRLLET